MNPWTDIWKSQLKEADFKYFSKYQINLLCSKIILIKIIHTYYVFFNGDERGVKAKYIPRLSNI